MLLWRVATSGKFNDTYLQICYEWDIETLMQALEMLAITYEVEKAHQPQK